MDSVLIISDQRELSDQLVELLLAIQSIPEIFNPVCRRCYLRIYDELSRPHIFASENFLEQLKNISSRWDSEIMTKIDYHYCPSSLPYFTKVRQLLDRLVLTVHRIVESYRPHPVNLIIVE